MVSNHIIRLCLVLCSLCLTETSSAANETISNSGIVPLSPIGKTGIRAFKWVFACQSEKEYWIEILNTAGSEVKSLPQKIKPKNGVCILEHKPFDSFRVSRGFLLVNKSYMWRVVAGDGTISSFRSFEIVPLFRSTFGEAPDNLIQIGGSWKVEEGFLKGDALLDDLRIVTNISQNGLLADKWQSSDVLYNGIDITASIMTNCPGSNCEVGFQFAGDTVTCKDNNLSSNCSRQSGWFELTIKSTGESSINRFELKETGSYTRTLIANLDDFWIDTSSPNEIRICRLEKGLWISINSNAAIKYIALAQAPSTVWYQSGFRWSTREDDAGQAYVQIDKFTVSTPAKRYNPYFPLPILD